MAIGGRFAMDAGRSGSSSAMMFRLRASARWHSGMRPPSPRRVGLPRIGFCAQVRQPAPGPVHGRADTTPSRRQHVSHLEAVAGQRSGLVGQDQVNGTERLLGIQSSHQDVTPQEPIRAQARMTASSTGGSSGMAAMAAEMAANRASSDRDCRE